MGWSIGYDDRHKRDIGYGVPAICDHPDCNKEIDRGLGYVCARQEPYGGDEGCGLFFCSDHRVNIKNQCERCAEEKSPFDPKPDIEEWNNWKLTDDSWDEWRKENQKEVERLKNQLEK